MKKIASLLLTILLLSLIFSSKASSSSQEPAVKIVIDNRNSTILVVVNNTQYFSLRFSKVYMGESFMGLHASIISQELKNMKVRMKRGYNHIMGNYTEILMWKNMAIKLKGPMRREMHMNFTVRFYVAEKEYYKKETKIGTNMLRYDIIMKSDSIMPFFYVQENVKYQKDSKPGEVYERIGMEHVQWKKLGKSEEIKEHLFGKDKKGMLRFGEEKQNIAFLWEYENDMDTFYSYSNSELHLIFSFRNYNGSVIYDPYIALPLPIYPNLQPVIGSTEKVISYLMDHIFSFSIGLIAAVTIIFIPMLRRRKGSL